ncbi:MAG: hypothetical protein DCC67_18800 [Planctomycetota bacterium]|nr:MAG: hypothetical protein DCC67_18800 [Planctomycetota bacterium]
MLCLPWAVLAGARQLHAEVVATDTLVVSCGPNNDLYQAMVRGAVKLQRFDSAEAAVDAAADAAAVLVLADDYPHKTTAISSDFYSQAAAKGLRLYVEYPEHVPGCSLGQPRGVRWERVVVAAEAPNLGLPKLRVLAVHDCQFLPVDAEAPLLTLARVAGYDEAVFGLPREHYPVLFRAAGGELIATTKLSNFVTGRYAPSADWLVLWSRLLDELHPAGAPHVLRAEPAARPSYSKNEALPADAERQALDRLAGWYANSRLLLTAERLNGIRDLLHEGQETIPPPDSNQPGDGSQGILEGYASQILPDGSQLQRTPIRADCQAETAAVFALHAVAANNARSRQTATNLLDYLYFNSELCQLERGNPKHPAFGHIAWGAVSPAWRVANYGDDNARALLATIAASACLESDRWDASVLRAMYANLRTTGKLGFRGDRIDMPQLEQQGWRAFAERETINYSPSFEAYLWACYLWTHAQTGEPEFLQKAKTGIRMTMEVYPEGWRWGDHLDRSRMLLALAWLVRVEDTPLHRRWLTQVASDLLQHQQPCGAIPEQLSGATTGHFLAPASNEAYGTSETPLLQHDGDPVTDQLYTSNFVLIGLHEAVAATNDPKLREAEDKLIDYIVRIQVSSEAIPYLHGTWFRAFDFQRWDFWSSSGDMGWGAWCAETGWGPAWNGIVLGLRLKQTSLWDLTASSSIERQVLAVRGQMAENDGGPWNPAGDGP